MAKAKTKKPLQEDAFEPGNEDMQAVDKAPGEERGKAEQVTKEDLKGKKIDADLSQEKDRPMKRKSK